MMRYTIDHSLHRCATCEGSGEYTSETPDRYGCYDTFECMDCHGDGWFIPTWFRTIGHRRVSLKPIPTTEKAA